MSAFAFVVGALMPYLTMCVFVAGMAYRFYVWAKTPQPSKMTLFYVKETSTVKGVLKDVLLFPSLFKGDRLLWSFAWVFHATLALVLLGHLRVFTAVADAMLSAMGMSSEGIDGLSATAGGAAGVLLVLTGAALLARRGALRRVREISRAPDFVALVLLVVIILTGDLMRFGTEPFDLEQTRLWAASLLSLSPVVPPNNLFLLHALLAQVLIVFIPFSKVMHFGGIFFTQALVKSR